MNNKENNKVDKNGVNSRERRKELLEKGEQDLPGGPVAKTPCSRAEALGSISGQGTRSHMLQQRVRLPQ